MKRSFILICFLLLLTGSLVAQKNTYAWKFYTPSNFGESDDTPSFSSAPSLLLLGYLQNKLTGYRFATRDSVIQWSSLNESDLPAEWNSHLMFYPNETVQFRGAFYRCVETNQNVEPKANSYTWEVVELRTPLVTKIFFPTEKDTLTKKEFLKRMVIEDSFIPAAWDSTINYLQDEPASYLGKVYQSRKDDNIGNIPSKSNQWYPSSFGKRIYANLDGPLSIAGLFHYQVNQSDTTWTPQFLGIDLNISPYFSKAIYFKYNDVIRYLNSIDQPFEASPDLNAVSAEQLFLDDLDEQILIRYLHKKLQSAKPPGLKILNDTLWSQWINSSYTSETYRPEFTITQHPHSGDLVVSVWQDVLLSYIGIVQIPKKGLKSLQITSPRANKGFFRPLDKLSDKTQFRLDSSSYYSELFIKKPFIVVDEEPLNIIEKPRPTRGKFVYEENYYAYDLASSKTIQEQINRAFDITSLAVKNGSISIVPEPRRRTLINWDDVDLSATTVHIPLINDDKQTLQQVIERLTQLNPTPKSITISYQRQLSIDGGQDKPQPMSLSFNCQDREGLFAVRVMLVRWQDLKKLLLQNGGQFKDLIKAVEGGQFIFTRSEIVSNPVESNR